MKQNKKNEWYNGQKLLSYNAIINFILGGRNIGKTWSFKKRAYKRAKKRGKKTIWVRRTVAEAAECASTFYTSIDLQKHCGIEHFNEKYNKQSDVPFGAVRFHGRIGEIYINGRWIWFVKVVALCEYKSMRSSDDVDCDTIIFDEFTATPEKYTLYRGNEAKDFIDLIVSIKRNHRVTVICSGNKESVSNPIINYFNIPPIPLKWQGIRTYKHNTIALQQVNDQVKTGSNFEERFEILLSGTDYGEYMTQGKYKNQPKIIIKRPPVRCTGYLQLCWRGNHINIKSDPKANIDEPVIYITNKNDINLTIFTDTMEHKFRKQCQLQKRAHKKYFRQLEQAVSDNRIAYDSYTSYENILPFYQWLGIKN